MKETYLSTSWGSYSSYQTLYCHHKTPINDSTIKIYPFDTFWIYYHSKVSI